MAIRNARRREIGAERRERTRQKLLTAAARVVAELGENKANIHDFIAAAGVARGTFYNYYSTREELLDDLWARNGRTPLIEIHQIIKTLKDPAERVTAGARLVLGRAAADPTWGWLVFALSMDAEAITEDLLAYPRAGLRLGWDTGRFHVDDIVTASDVIIGAVRSGLLAILREKRRPDYAEALSVLLLRALGISDAEARDIAAKPLPRIVEGSRPDRPAKGPHQRRAILSHTTTTRSSGRRSSGKRSTL